jgi:hypothetical protein
LELARELGMTRDELLKRMSSREVADWRALAIIEAEERRKAEAEAKAKAKGRGR